MGVGTGKGLEGRKYDAVESSGGVFHEYRNTAREGGRKFAIDLRMRVLAGLRVRLSDHVAIYSQTEPVDVRFPNKKIIYPVWQEKVLCN